MQISNSWGLSLEFKQGMIKATFRPVLQNQLFEKDIYCLWSVINIEWSNSKKQILQRRAGKGETYILPGFQKIEKRTCTQFARKFFFCNNSQFFFRTSISQKTINKILPQKNVMLICKEKIAKTSPKQVSIENKVGLCQDPPL